MPFYSELPSLDQCKGPLAQNQKIERSSMSHILNGRNKPSLEIITKICKVFPDVKLNWLVLGENNDNNSNSTPIKSKNIDNTNSSDVEKIILLLKDGTFKTFEN